MLVRFDRVPFAIAIWICHGVAISRCCLEAVGGPLALCCVPFVFLPPLFAMLQAPSPSGNALLYACMQYVQAKCHLQGVCASLDSVADQATARLCTSALGAAMVHHICLPWVLCLLTEGSATCSPVLSPPGSIPPLIQRSSPS